MQILREISSEFVVWNSRWPTKILISPCIPMISLLFVSKTTILIHFSLRKSCPMSGPIWPSQPRMGMAYIDCPELSSVFGCDVVVHATQAHLETSGCSQYTLQHSNQTWLADAGKSKKCKKNGGWIGTLLLLINKHGDVRWFGWISLKHGLFFVNDWIPPWSIIGLAVLEQYQSKPHLTI